MTQTVLSLWKGELTVAPTMASIATTIAYENGMTMETLRSPQSARRIARARHQAMYHMVEERRWSSTQIGRFFGMDHCSVLYGHEAHRRRIAGLPTIPRRKRSVAIIMGPMEAAEVRAAA